MTNLDSASGRAAGRGLAAALLWLVAVLPAVLGQMFHAHTLLNHDVAWLLLAARRMVEGGSYARDFFEINMPLAIAVYIPPDLLTRFLRLSLEDGLSLYVAALALQSACLSAYCLTAGEQPAIDARWRSLLCAWLLVGLLFLPGKDFGQKEHLVALLVLPMLCAGVRNDGLAALDWRLRGYLVALAALGCYLKPHYAALPFALLAMEVWRRRSWQALRSRELMILLALGAANAAWTLLVYPDWLDCARWAADLYGSFHARHWNEMLRPDAVRLSALCVATQIVAMACSVELRRRLTPLLLGAVYAATAYLLQLKGWDYQALVLELIVFTAQGFLLLAALHAVQWSATTTAAVAALGCGAAALVLGTVQAMRTPLPYGLVGRIAQSLPEARRGDSVYAFTSEVTPVFPAVPELGLKWASRYSHLWPLLKLARAQHGLEGAAGPALERRYLGPFVDSVVEDFERNTPDYVLVDRRPLDVLPENFDILGMFLADPRFARIWSGYTSTGVVMLSRDQMIYEVYRRRRPPPAALSPEGARGAVPDASRSNR